MASKWVAVRLVQTSGQLNNFWKCRGCAEGCSKILPLCQDPNACTKDETR